MKKTLIILILAIAGILPMSAQVISSPTDNLLLVFTNAKRTGTDVELTLLLTNLAPQEMMVTLIGGVYQNGTSASMVYDNLGNIYELGSVQVAVGKQQFTQQEYGISIPPAVSIKCKMLVKDVDFEATMLNKVKLCILCPALGLNLAGTCFELNQLPFY